MRELILIFAILMPSIASGQDIPLTRLTPIEDATGVMWVPLARVTQPVEDAARNAVILDFPAGNGTGSRGSGVYLGSKYVATAWHVPEGTQQRGTATFRDGTRIGCVVNGKDTAWDQCIVTLDREHPSLPGVSIADRDPAVGEEVYSVGFGQGFRIFGGAVTGYAGSQRAPGNNWFNHQSPAVSGDSGGPIFNQTGQLIGCLWGAGNGQTIGTRSSQFHVFVKPLFPHLAQWRANRIGRQIAGIAPAQGGCITGTCPQQPPSRGINYPQAPPPITPPTPPTPVSPSPSESCPCTDLDTLAQGVLDRLAKDDSLASRLRGAQGPAGAAGPQGPKGDKGDPGEVSQAQLASVVTAVVKSIKEDPNMRGPAGPKGDAGPTGPAGEITPAQLAKLKAELLAEIQHPNIRVVIGSKGRIIDDETYKPGEPIVLDIEALVRAASAK